MANRPVRGRPTIVDVARKAGVSPATVSNHFNDRRSVGPTTKRRITEVAAQLGYTPNVHARRMRTTGIGTIAIFSSMPFAISSDVSRLGFLMEIAATAAVTALEHGFALLLVPSISNEPMRLDTLAIDAAIVLEPSANDPYVTQLRARAVPMVTIGKAPGMRDVASIDIRSRETARMLLEHLRERGAKHIALMTGETRRNSYLETESAYTKFARTYNIEPVAVRIDERGGEDAAYAATRGMLREHPTVDAILALVDTFATGAVRALAELAKPVPQAILVATRYDGIRARESRPNLTAVNLHLADVAKLAIELLLDQIESGPHAQRVTARLPTLIPRESTRSDSF